MATEAVAEVTNDLAKERPEGIRALERGLSILRYLSTEAGGRGMSLTEVSRNLGLHKSTVHRLLDTMKRQGFVRQDPDSERYLLGYMVLNVAASLLNTLDLRGITASEIQELARETGHTVHLAIWDRGEVVYLNKVEMGEWTRSSTNVGMRNPAYCTSSGKAMLAYLPEEALEETLARGLVARSSYTITTEKGLRSALRQVCSNGYAVEDREISVDSRGVAAPIFDYRGRVVGAIAVAGLDTVLTPERIETLAPRIVKAAASVSRRLGYKI